MGKGNKSALTRQSSCRPASPTAFVRRRTSASQVRERSLARRAVAAKQRRLVPLAGIEPALLAELDFESSASTSSATGAFGHRLWAGGAKPAEYSGRSVPVNPRGCDIAEPRQQKSRAIPRDTGMGR